jgi:hypothetical protein
MQKSVFSFACLFLSTFLLYSLSAQAQSGRSIERDPEQMVSCDEFNVCTYIVQNKTSAVNRLILDAKNLTFGNRYILNTEDAHIMPNGGSILFRIIDPKKKDEFLANLKRFDRLYDLSILPEEFKISFKAYAMETNAYKNFEIGLSLFSSKLSPKEKAPARLESTNSITKGNIITTALSWVFGNLKTTAFGLNLDLSRLSAWSLESTVYEVRATNGQNISIARGKDVYNKEVSSAATTEKANTGFNVSGVVTLDKTGQKIIVTDFGLTYSSPTNEENSISETTLVNRPSVVFDLDSPNVIVTSTVNVDTNSNGGNLGLAKKKNSNTTESKLIIVFTATRIHNEEANNTEIKAEAEAGFKRLNFDSNPQITLTEIFGAATGYVRGLEKGNINEILFGQYAGFYIPETVVSRELSEVQVLVTEKNLISGETKQSYPSLKDLTSQFYTFKTLNFAKLQSPCQKRADGCQLIPIEISMQQMGEASKVQMLMNYLPAQQKVVVAPTKAIAAEAPPAVKKTKAFSFGSNRQ